MKAPLTFLSARGKRRDVVAPLNHLAPALRKAAALTRANKRHEDALGKQLAPILRRLVKRKDEAGLCGVADCLTQAGLMSGRFFYEAAYRLRPE